MYRTLLLAIGVIALVATGAANDVIRLDITPRICLSPCFMKLRIRIEQHETNHLLRVLVDGGMYRYSEIALTVKSPTLFVLDYPGLPAGMYGIAVDLVRHDAGDRVVGKAVGQLEVTE